MLHPSLVLILIGIRWVVLGLKNGQPLAPFSYALILLASNKTRVIMRRAREWCFPAGDPLRIFFGSHCI
jgi:hypothetical protein